MKSLVKKIVISFGISSLLLLSACEDSGTSVSQPTVNTDTVSLGNNSNTLSGPITHGGETYRSRARVLKDYISPEADEKKSVKYKADAIYLWNFIEILYGTTDFYGMDQLRPVFDTLFKGEIKIQDEIRKSKLVVKTFAPYEYSGSEEDYERLYGNCFVTLASGKKQLRTSSTEAKNFADICIDAKVLAEEVPTEGELIGLISGHELLHHFGYTEEDAEIALMQDFISVHYDKLKKYGWWLFASYIEKPEYRKIVQAQVGDKIEMLFEGVKINEDLAMHPSLLAKHVLSSNNEFFRKEESLSFDLRFIDDKMGGIDTDLKTAKVDISSVFSNNRGLYGLQGVYPSEFSFETVRVVINGEVLREIDLKNYSSLGIEIR